MASSFSDRHSPRRQEDDDESVTEPARVSGKAFRNFKLGFEAAADVVSDSYYDTDDGGALDFISPIGSGSKTPVSENSSPKRLRPKDVQRRAAATVTDVSSFTQSLKSARSDGRISSRSLSAGGAVLRSPSYLALESEIDDLLGNGT